MTDYKEFETVQEMVQYLEDEYEITVISLRDYGSRAWNLDSETSDMDAGMVFRQRPMEYIELGAYRKNIDRKFYIDGEEFELIGWNIKRFAELLNKSNPSMIEWLNSDICYYESYLKKGSARITKLNHSESLFNDIREHANQEFKPISLFYHYRSMAKSNFTKYIENGNDLSIKRHLYILRGLTYARHVEKTHSVPPLDYTEFYNNELKELKENGTIPDMVYRYIGRFIEDKKNGDGDKTLTDQELHDWISEELEHKLDNEEHDIRGIDREKVNNLLQRMIPAR